MMTLIDIYKSLFNSFLSSDLYPDAEDTQLAEETGCFTGNQ